MTSLHPFIGLNDKEEPEIFISPFSCYKVSPMHERGKGFPEEVYGKLTEEQAFSALRKLTKYYNAEEEGRTKKRKAA